MSYKPTLTRTWWLKHRFFMLYMLREGTVLPLVFLLCSLSAGAFALQSVEQFASWQRFMANPWVVAIHTVALIAALYHAFTFFKLFPRVMPIRVGTKLVPPAIMVVGQWLAVVAVITVFLWLFVFSGAAHGIVAGPGGGV
ncbi:fumarate reductase subunit C [Idiomarina sp. A28L]|uniref:fumarate reductase n=1 Tax=Idiomarina sp. A28L TaxID=1036674 RepID=UPI0002138D2B|nr:fumarate reductase [Idiomarina sp. A28L]EGN75476.1 fumarate reductase subunit C [Idiomarina sp. A28L]